MARLCRNKYIVPARRSWFSCLNNSRRFSSSRSSSSEDTLGSSSLILGFFWITIVANGVQSTWCHWLSNTLFYSNKIPSRQPQRSNQKTRGTGTKIRFFYFLCEVFNKIRFNMIYETWKLVPQLKLNNSDNWKYQMSISNLLNFMRILIIKNWDVEQAIWIIFC